MFARVSRFCFRHRYLVVLIWVAALAGGVAASGPVFAALSRESDVRFESTDAFDVLREARPDGGTVVGVVDRVDPGAPGTRAAVTTSAAALRRESGVLRVDEPYSAGPAAAGLIAPDGRAVLVLVHLRKDLGDREDAVVDAAAARLRAIDDRVPGARVEVGGGALLDREINAQVQRDLSTAELVALPLTLLFMVVVFGGFLAAGVPVVGALASMGAAMLGLWGFSTFTTLDSNTITVVTLLGLGLSIDYGLLVLSRYREELARVAVAPSGVTVGPDRWGVGLIAREEAMARTGATAGRTVAFSALTVAAALGGLIVMGVPFMQALGAAGISIALVTMLSALTLVPALARIAGRRIRPAKRRAEHAGQGFFAGLARRVQHRPLLVLALTLTALALLAAPLLSARLTNPELDGIPRTLESKRVADTLDARFARHGEPAIVVVARTDPSALDTWAARHAGDRGVTSIEPAESVAPGLSTVDVHVAGDPRGGPARALVEAFRADRPDGGQSWVSGTAAFFTDQLALLRRDLPWALGVMVAAMLVLLFAMTGSVVVPLKALAMNLVSMGATFGVMVAAFQWGWGAGPLDLLVNAGLDPFVLVIIFAFAFGLSMDYETFLLARIKEAYDGGLPNDEAVRAGLQRSGRIITSAAVAMVIVFGAFVDGRIGTVEQIGLGLVVAVLVDATIVRCLLVPATMTLLGRANWWAPRPLRALHRRFGLREAAAAPAPVERELTAVG